MRKLVEIAESLNDDDRLPIGLLTGAGIIYGLLASETTFKEESKNSLRRSSHGGGSYYLGHDGSVFQSLLDQFDSRRLGIDPEGESLPFLQATATLGMITAEIPAMRVNPKQVISWWETEHKVEGVKFQGGGLGVGF